MIVQVRFLVIQADTGGDGKPFDKKVIVGRLVESREAVGRRVEVSGEINLVQFVPLDSKLRCFWVIRRTLSAKCPSARLS